MYVSHISSVVHLAMRQALISQVLAVSALPVTPLIQQFCFVVDKSAVQFINTAHLLLNDNMLCKFKICSTGAKHRPTSLCAISGSVEFIV